VPAPGSERTKLATHHTHQSRVSGGWPSWTDSRRQETLPTAGDSCTASKSPPQQLTALSGVDTAQALPCPGGEATAQRAHGESDESRVRRDGPRLRPGMPELVHMSCALPFRTRRNFARAAGTIRTAKSHAPQRRAKSVKEGQACRYPRLGTD